MDNNKLMEEELEELLGKYGRAFEQYINNKGPAENLLYNLTIKEDKIKNWFESKLNEQREEFIEYLEDLRIWNEGISDGADYIDKEIQNIIYIFQNKQ